MLAVVAGALRTFLISRGVRTEGVELRALVPVSVRTEDEHHRGGNRIVVMRGPLPVYIADPVDRLRFVSHEMAGLKESKQALGAEVIAGAQNFAPPTILAQASRLNFSTRLFNLIVTNVPGPQFPLYVLGREMLQAIPVAFLPENHALAIAIMSYNGQLNFGLLGDFDALPDIDVIGENIARRTGHAARARPRDGGGARLGPLALLLARRGRLEVRLTLLPPLVLARLARVRPLPLGGDQVVHVPVPAFAQLVDGGRLALVPAAVQHHGREQGLHDDARAVPHGEVDDGVQIVRLRHLIQAVEPRVARVEHADQIRVGGRRARLGERHERIPSLG